MVKDFNRNGSEVENKGEIKSVGCQYISSGVSPDQGLTKELFEQLVLEKIAQVNFTSAKADMQPFITDAAQITDWSPDFFRYILSQTNIRE